MASSLQTFARRAPFHSILSCSRAPTTTTTPTTTYLALRPLPSAAATQRSNNKLPLLQQAFGSARAFADHATAAQRVPDAAKYKTASDLGAKRPSSRRTHEVPSRPAGTEQPAVPLQWNDFFQLRLKRRRIQVFFSGVGAVGGGTLGAGLVASGLAEPLAAQLPLDPFVSMGLMTLACAVMGWLAGPSLGGQVFYLLNGRVKPKMKEKEAEFFARVRKHRVDPANSGAGNPVPDFYGEKIQSVAGYRRWLKDQRAFNKKKTSNFV
ncbi:hypothetical protein N3K66_000284 [Trichothecium roseum]|uniref:Uncharacterized protein n=1 Tax=Trichothecium roseum TaxID=47278 RepID=A0ACC0VDG6_9HYPO|nr:hypothetical protein N3K66_000284 [Trichothecium roseum]